jgi:hypothetical protein
MLTGPAVAVLATRIAGRPTQLVIEFARKQLIYRNLVPTIFVNGTRYLNDNRDVRRWPSICVNGGSVL